MFLISFNVITEVCDKLCCKSIFTMPESAEQEAIKANGRAVIAKDFMYILFDFDFVFIIKL